MPKPETSFRRQWAVLWPAGGYDEFGQPTVGEPQEIQVRWVNRQSRALSPEGNTITLDASVVTVEDIPVGSIMWEGTLDDWYGIGSAGQDSGLMEVVSADYTPDLKGRVWRKNLGLKFYKDTLPRGTS